MSTTHGALTAENTPLISKVKLPGDTTIYNLHDDELWDKVADIAQSITQAMQFIGKTTSALSDGSTLNPIKIDGEDYTAKNGDVTFIDGTPQQEFVWSGSSTTGKWQELGSTGSLKALAFKASASGSFTPNINVTGAISVSSTTIPASTNPLTLSTTEVTGATSFKAVNTVNSFNNVTAVSYSKATSGTATVNSSATFTGTIEAVKSVGANKNTATTLALSSVTSGGTSVVTAVGNPTKATSGAVTVGATTVYGLAASTTKYMTGPETLSKGTAVTALTGATTNANAFNATVTDEILTFTATAGTVTANGTASVMPYSATITAGTSATATSKIVGASGSATVTDPTYTISPTTVQYKVAIPANTYVTGLTGGTAEEIDVSVKGSAVTTAAVAITNTSTAATLTSTNVTPVTTSTFYGTVTTPSTSHTHAYNGNLSVAGATTSVTVS